MMNEEYKTHIKVIGVGGGGISAVNHMIAAALQGVTFIAVDTDKQALSTALCSQAIQLGVSRTKGQGCGACAHTGSEAALENIDEIKAALNGADLALVVAGMGGGAGTGVAPVVAQVAKELGALTIGLVTEPFLFEGKRRLETAVAGIQALLNVVDSLIIIPCDRLIQLAPKNITFMDMLKTANEALHCAAGSITDIFIHRSLVDIDFADIREAFEGKGKAAMGFGAASGESRARDAAKRAIGSPLLDGSCIADADNMWLYITSNASITIEEVTEVVTAVCEEAHEEARILFGTRLDDSVGDELHVTVIALWSATPKNQTFDKDSIGTDAKCAMSNDTFVFDEDEFDVPPSMRDKLSGGLDVSDFIWKGKGGLRYRIHTEHPYRVCVEQEASSEDKNNSTSCKVLKFINMNRQ